MNQKQLNNSLEKILTFKWEYDEEMQDVYQLHVKEYLHRSAIWAKKFRMIDKFPFFDFTKCISENSEIAHIYVQKLDEYFEKFYFLSFQVKSTCYYYLNWSSSIDKSKLQVLNVPNPFEPLISLYEKNGHFRLENNFLWLNTQGLYIRECSAYLSH